jgi:PAS domain-containing protein
MGRFRPFDTPRFVDPQARAAFIERLASEGAVTDYLLRLRRVDNSALWVEVTAHADSPSHDGSVRIDALVRDVSERKKLEDQTRDCITSSCRPKSWRRSARRFRASPTS